MQSPTSFQPKKMHYTSVCGANLVINYIKHIRQTNIKAVLSTDSTGFILDALKKNYKKKVAKIIYDLFSIFFQF